MPVAGMPVRLVRMGKATGKSGRHAMVLVHVLASVGWLTLGLTQMVLRAYGAGADPSTRRSAYTMAVFIDHNILQVFAPLTLYTGLMLSAMTSWGLFRYWWVTWKFVLTVVGIAFGIGLLGQWSEALTQASEQGVAMPVGRVIAGAASVVAGLALAVWLSVAKPGGRVKRGAQTRQARHRDAPAPPQWLWFALLAVPLVDILLLGYPMVQLLVAIGFPIFWAWRGRVAVAAARV